MDKITEMAEGIAVQNAPTHKTRDEIMGMSKGKVGTLCVFVSGRVLFVIVYLT